MLICIIAYSRPLIFIKRVREFVAGVMALLAASGIIWLCSMLVDDPNTKVSVDKLLADSRVLIGTGHHIRDRLAAPAMQSARVSSISKDKEGPATRGSLLGESEQNALYKESGCLNVISL